MNQTFNQAVLPLHGKGLFTFGGGLAELREQAFTPFQLGP
jgi:hypothetical protein